MNDILFPKVLELFSLIRMLIPLNGTLSYIASNGMKFEASCESDCPNQCIRINYIGGITQSGFSVSTYRRRYYLGSEIDSYRHIIRNSLGHYKTEYHYFLEDNIDKMLLALRLFGKEEC